MKPLILHLILSILPIQAHARAYDLYRADYPKGAFCSAIGGACAAESDLVNSFFQNPAALSNGTPDWNFDGDFASKNNLERGLSRSADVTESTADGGFAYSDGNWGIGISFQYSLDRVNSPITITDTNNNPFSGQIQARATSFTLRLPVSYMVNPKLSLGMAAAVLIHNQKVALSLPPASGDSSARDSKFGFTLGAIYTPKPTLHFGSWFSIPTKLEENLTFAGLASSNIQYSENFSLRYPWIFANGAAMDLSERWQIYLEADLIGSTSDGYLLSYSSLNSADSENGLRAKGRRVIFEPHAGARYALTEKLRLHLGSFYEVSRTHHIHSRLHGTGGISYKVLDWLEVIGSFDVANRYSQFFFSFR